MDAAPPMSCPGADELERFVGGEGVSTPITDHLAGCAGCRERERVIRENLRFMDGLRRDLGPSGLVEPCAPARPAPADLPGYHLVREIARGGQGTVYEAVQLETRRRVAVKMIDAGEAGSEEADRGRRRVEREAEIAAGLRHPNIVTVYHSAALADGRYALAMEYLDGPNLDGWARTLDESTPADRARQREAVRLKLRAFAGVCDAVQHAHQNGVIHRDLKPANVLVDEHGVPRVVDFGIARRTTPGPAAGITRAGEFAGTLAYASPEQVSGDAESVDTRSDVYSLGLILYELLTGRRPYQTQRSLTGAIQNITKAEPAPLGGVKPGDAPAGDELETIVRKTLSKDRGQRYQTAGELKADIENWLAGRAINAKGESAIYLLRKTASRYRVAVGVVAGFLVVLMGFAAAMAWSARRLDRERVLLAASLSSSTVERGRLLSLNGSNARAESMIWPELLRTGARVDDPGLGFESTAEVTQAAWAMFELYSRHPCVLSVRALRGAQAVGFERTGGGGGEEVIRLTRADGAWETRRVLDGALVASGAPVFAGLSGSGMELLDTDQRRTLVLGTAGRGGGGAESGTIRVLEFATGRELMLSDPLLKGLSWATLSGDGRRLVTITSSGGDGSLRLWEVEPLRVIAVLAAGLLEQSRAFTFEEPSGEKMIAAGVGDTVQTWDAADGRPRATWRIGHRQWTEAMSPVINVIQISRDRRFMAAGVGSQLLIFKADDPSAAPAIVAAHRGFVNFVGFSADSSTLLTSGHERSFRAWDAATHEPLGNFEQSTVSRGIPAISADGTLAANGSVMDSVRVWETRPRRWLTRLREPSNTVHCVRFSPDGRLVGAASSDGVVRVWRSADHGLVWSGPGPDELPGPLTALAFSPDGRTLAVAATGGEVFTCDAATGERWRGLARGPIRVTWIGYSPDGAVLALAASDGRVHLYDASGGAEVGMLGGRAGEGHSARVVEAAFGRDGSWLASAGADGAAILWDVPARAVRMRLEGHAAPVRAVAISADGGQVATGSDDWTIRLWDAKTGRCTRIIRDVKQHVFGLAFHPGGNLLFSCCRDSDVQVWDVRSGREVATLEGHESSVLTLALSPDGRALATGSGDRTVGLWDLAYYQRHVRGNAGALDWLEPRP